MDEAWHELIKLRRDHFYRLGKEWARKVEPTGHTMPTALKSLKRMTMDVTSAKAIPRQLR